MTQPDRTALLVDVQNIYYTCRDAYGRQFNYRHLWQRLSQYTELKIANAYAVDRGDIQQQKFQSALRHIGFEVKLKPWVQRADGSAKGDWDVGITIDALTAAPDIDRLILLSGDGDFELLLQTLQQRHGVICEVYGVPGLTAQALINTADHFTAIDETLLI